MIYTVTLNPSLDRTLYFNQLSLGEVNRSIRTQINLGGKGVNVSLALDNLGIPNVPLGLAGGTTGEILVRGLAKRGRCAFTFIEGETRSNITAIDLKARLTTKLNEPGPVVSDKELEQFTQTFTELVKPHDFIILSGSLPPGVPDETYAHLIHQAHKQGAMCALDTSGAALVASCQAQPDWVKPNLEEAAYLTGLDMINMNWREAIAKITDFGVKYILLSAGEHGLIMADTEHAWHAVPPQVSVTSTVGAGDAALASAIAAWNKGLDLREIARWAAAAGTAAAMLDGSSMPEYEQIRAVYANTKSSCLY